MTQIYRDVVCHNGRYYCTTNELAMRVKDFMDIMAKSTVLRDPDDEEDLTIAWAFMRAKIPEIKEQTPAQVFEYISNHSC